MDGDDDGLVRLPTLEEVDAEVERRMSPRSGGQGVALLVVSTLLFVGAQHTFGEAPLTFIGLLVVVLVLHELGHLVAMRAFGFRDLRMFFIPFFGAAASGRKPDATGAQRAIVALAGPLSGIFLAIALVLGLRLSDVEVGNTTIEFVGLLLVLNFFNLLPLLPFDGGRFVNIVLFSRWPTAERVFRIAASLGMMWLAYQLESWLLGIIGFFVLVGAGFAARLGVLGQDLRARVPAPRPVSWLDTPPELRAALIEELAPTIGLQRDHRANVRRYGMVFHSAWERAIDAPPGPVASVALLLLYLAVCGLGVGLYFYAIVSQ